MAPKMIMYKDLRLESKIGAQLRNEEDPPSEDNCLAEPEEEEQPAIMQAVQAAATPNTQTATAWHEQEVKFTEAPLPPSYSVATSLPTYEEAERSKEEEAQRAAERPVPPPQPVSEVDRFGDMQLGTDGMFLCMFILAFIFNWIGLLASLCITRTVAGLFGAIAGFGLSMVKWAAIVKVHVASGMVPLVVGNHTTDLAHTTSTNHSMLTGFTHNNWAGGIAAGDSWLWWLLIILGFLIFFRGCTQYIRLKYQWHRLGHNLRSRVYLFL